MSSSSHSSSNLQTPLDDIMLPSSTSVWVITRPRSLTLPTNFAPSETSVKTSLPTIASSNVDVEEMEPAQVLQVTALLRSLLYFFYEPVRKFLALFRLKEQNVDKLDNSKEMRSNSAIIGSTAREILREHEFGFFKWFPTEVKLKILAYAFDAPRIVSVSCKQLKHNLMCHGHTRLVNSGPQHPHLYVDRLARYQALRYLQNLFQFNTLHIGCPSFPTIKYNPASDIIWIREIDFWSSSNQYSCSFTLPSRNRAVRSLAITTSSNEVIMELDNLYRLSCILSHWFKGLVELVVIVDDLDFTTPGVREDIVFLSRKSNSLPKHGVVTKYFPTISSLSSELIFGLLYGEWKAEHWHTSVSCLIDSLKSFLSKRQKAEQTIPIPIEKISAVKLHTGLQEWKSRLEVLNDNGEESRRKMIENFRTWTVPAIKLLAAATRKQIEGRD